MSGWRNKWEIVSTAAKLQHLQRNAIWIPFSCTLLSTRTACLNNFHKKMTVYEGRSWCQILLDHARLTPFARISSAYNLEEKSPFTEGINTSLTGLSFIIKTLEIFSWYFRWIKCHKFSNISKVSRIDNRTSLGKGPWRVSPSQLSPQKLISSRPTIHWVKFISRGQWLTMESQRGECYYV